MKRDDLPLEAIKAAAEACTENHVAGVDYPAFYLTELDADFQDVIEEALLRHNPKTWSEVRLERRLHEAERRAEV